MNKTEISALAEKAQAGDKAAFETLYNEFYGRVYFFAKRNVGSEDKAQDIASETFVTALESISQLRSGESFIGWLYSIAYSKCVSVIKDSAKSEHFEDDGQMEKALADASLNQPVMLPEDYAVNNDTKEKLKAVIDELPADQRSAVILYYYQDMSVAEVASSLGIKENNAKQKLFKARKNIRSRIEKLFKGAVLAAVPFESLMSNTVDPSFAQAAASGAAKVAVRSLAVKLLSAGAAAAVAVGVPVALNAINENGSGGEYRPEEIISQTESAPDSSQPEPEKPKKEVIVWYDNLSGNEDEEITPEFSGTMTLEAFPDTVFSWKDDEITITENGSRIDMQDFKLRGMPIWNGFFTDLNGDDHPELCITVSCGSGIVDNRILVYDCRNKKGYTLAERMVNDYVLILEGEELTVRRIPFNPDNDSEKLKRETVFGSLAIENDELIFREHYTQSGAVFSQNEHFKMTFELSEIKDGKLYYTVSLEGVDDFGKDYIKNSQAVRDYIFYHNTLDPYKQTGSEFNSMEEAYQKAHKDEPYESLFPMMYALDEEGEKHYCSGGSGDRSEISETVCTEQYQANCPAGADSLTLHFLQLENDKGLDNLKAGIFEGMDITFDLSEVPRK